MRDTGQQTVILERECPMPMRASLCVTLCCVALLPAGCGRKTEAAPEGEPPPGTQQVTLHVKDMAERLDLT